MTPSATRSAPTASASASTLPSPFWIVTATPPGASSFAATLAAHGVPYVFVQTTAAPTGGSPARSGERVRSTRTMSARPSSARATTCPIAPIPRIATRTPALDHLLRTERLAERPLERSALALLHGEGVL